MSRFLTGCAVVLLVCLQTAAQEAPDKLEVSGSDLVSDPKLTTRRAQLFPLRNPQPAAPNPFARPPAPPFEKDRKKDDPSASQDTTLRGFNWKGALQQSSLLLALQHGYALTQVKTRRELRGPFFRDYFDSLGNLRGWADGGRFFTNYVAHPLQGAATGFIQIQNDPDGARREFSGDRAYWRSRLKALGWSALNSTQFELGPVSQASIGNVGKARKLTYVDLVITPTVGTAMLVGEDFLDRHVVRRLERGSDSLLLRVAARMLLNPARSCANVLRFKKPWHRDTR
jgi:hypothetical protein